MGATDKPLQVYCLCKHMGSRAASRHPCRQRHLEPDYPHISLTIIKELLHFTFVIGLQLATSPEHLPPQTLHWSCQNHRAFDDSLHLPALHSWIFQLEVIGGASTQCIAIFEEIQKIIIKLTVFLGHCTLWKCWELCAGVPFGKIVYATYMRWSRTRTQHML